jgi:hypothetical protein
MSSLKWPASGQQVWESRAADDSGRFPHPLGARGEDVFGRTFRYAVAGAVALVVGNALQSAAQISDHQDMAPSAAAIGDKTITVTPAATAGAKNLYAGGMAIISVTPGLGYAYPIKSHEAITASTAFTINLADGWPVQVALVAATSKVTLAPSPYKNVIQSPVTTLTGTCVGVCAFPLALAEGGWIGTGGVFGTLIQGTPGVGLCVGPPASAAGAVAVNSSTNPIVGTMMDTGEDGKVSPVKWTLDE